MELKYLITLKKIIETGSYQQAAAALNYAQSTITFQIKQLERELGLQLFERHGSSMVLTQAGAEVMPLVDRVLDSVTSLEQYCSQRDELHGSLTLALPETLTTYKLQPVLQSFKEQAPDVRLRLRCMNCFDIYHELCGSDIDIAIHYDVGNYPKSVEVVHLMSFPLALLASPRLSTQERDFLTPGQRKRLCHIQDDPDALSLKIFQEYLRAKEIRLDAALEVWSIEAIKRSVMSNLGIAMLPRFTAEKELAAGELIELPTAIEQNSMTAICAYQKGRWRSKAMQLFLKILFAYFQEQR